MTTLSGSETLQEIPTAQETMQRYPRLTAHLICESLGYFTPTAAANAIRDHQTGRGNHCEWYSHMATSGKTMLEIGARTINNAFRRRRFHQGPMAHYPQALALVQESIRHHDPTLFSSWQ